MNVNNKDRALLYWAGGHRTPGPLTSDWPAAARPLAASFSCSLPIGQRLSLLRLHWSVNRSHEVTMNHPRNKNCRNVSRHLTPADATLILRWCSLLTLQLDPCVCNCDDGRESVGSFKMNDSPSKTIINLWSRPWPTPELWSVSAPVTWHTTRHTAPHTRAGEESWHRWCLWLHQSCKIIKTNSGKETDGEAILQKTGIRKTDTMPCMKELWCLTMIRNIRILFYVLDLSLLWKVFVMTRGGAEMWSVKLIPGPRSDLSSVMSNVRPELCRHPEYFKHLRDIYTFCKLALSWGLA